MRTNKYFSSGMYTIKTFTISQQKQVKSFATTVTVSGIDNDTPANAIMAAIKEQIEELASEGTPGKVALKEINFACISLIDSFIETPIAP